MSTGRTSRTAPAGAAALQKAFDVLDVVARTGGATAAEIAAELAMPRPTVHRMLGALQLRGMVRQDEVRGRFNLGYRLFELAHRAWSDIDLRGAAQGPLDRLRDVTREVVTLGIRSGSRFVCIDRRDSAFDIRPIVSVGQSEALAASASGLAVLHALALAHAEEGHDLDPAVVAEMQAGDFLPRARLTLARGYAVASGAGPDAISSVAAPIVDFVGRPIASVGVVGPSSRLDPATLHALAPDVMTAARQITSNAGSTIQSIEPRPRPAEPPDPGIRVEADARMLMGKTPVHDRRSGRVLLVDHLAPALIACAGGGRAAATPRAELEVIAGLTAGGEPVVANRFGAFRLSAGGGEACIAPMPETLRGSRLNGAATDPGGRIWVSTMDLQGRADGGALHRIVAGRFETVLAPFTIPTAPVFSPDGRCLYLAETARQSVLRFSADLSGGGLSDRTTLATFPPEWGRPDGLASDAEGGIWVAMWDGWRVVRLRPDGTVDRVIVLPVPRPVDLCFGGPEGCTLFVATARVRLRGAIIAEAPLSGALLAIDAGVPGMPVAPVAEAS